MFKTNFNTKQQGDVGLGAAIAYFCSQGTVVSIPLTESQDYDLVVDMGNGLQKVQVKTTYSLQNGRPRVELKTSGGSSGRVLKTFDQNQSDYLFVLTSTGARYLIPKSAIGSKNCMILGQKYAQYYV